MEKNSMRIAELHKPIVYVDMDGVLVDLFNHVAALHDVDHYNEMTDQQWEDFFRTTDAFQLFANAPAFPNANEILQLVVDMFGGYQILSSPLNFDREGSILGKKSWIKKHVTVPADGYVFEHEKFLYAVQPNGTKNILIDDWRVNTTKWANAGGISIKFQNDENNISELNAALVQAKSNIE